MIYKSSLVWPSSVYFQVVLLSPQAVVLPSKVAVTGLLTMLVTGLHTRQSFFAF